MDKQADTEYRNEIIEMANKAYAIDDGKPLHPSALFHLEIFAKLVANKERTACANLCENMALYTGVDCADAIRARSCATSRGEA
jgi:hypothetical protein